MESRENTSLSANMDVCYEGPLERPPPNNSRKPARKHFLNRHYITEAINEIIHIHKESGAHGYPEMGM